MSAQRIENFVSPEEYLALDRAADHRSEYFSGEMVAMAGGSEAHERIVLNLGAELRPLLRATPCRALGSNMRVRVTAANYLYPDLTITCGEARYDDAEHVDTLLNPTVVFEVLSPSTESKDRGIKWRLYKRLETLKQYVLIHQDIALVEIFTRQADGDWLVHSEEGVDKLVRLSSIDICLPMSGIYEDIKLQSKPEIA